MLDQRRVVARRGGRAAGQCVGRAARTSATRAIIRRRAGPPAGPGQHHTAARPAEVVKAAYLFAAQHPEVLKYMPCFCGCERGGHRGNDDCFVSARDAAGKPTQWEQHGMVCEVCIDVATQARQMHSSGASVSAIREAIEKKYARRAAPHADADAAEEGHARLVICRSPIMKPRSAGLADDAFAHLFEALQEGVYIGLVSRDETATLAANPHLRSCSAGRPTRADP